jgi:hypothetical protein
MAEHRKSEALLPESGQSLQFDAGRKLNSTSRSDLDPARGKRRIASNSHQHRNVHQRAGGSGVKSQAQDGAATWPIEFRPDDDEAAPRIE